MSARKQIMTALKILDRRLWSQQMQLNEHRRYFQALFQNNLLMLSSVLLPAFFAGWASGRVPAHKLKHFGKYVMLTVGTHIKKL